MDLGLFNVSDTYQYVLNQSGANAVTLGNGNAVNWNAGGVVALTGNQSINGEKYFNDIISAPNVYITNSTTDASLEIGGNGNVYIDLKKPSNIDYSLRMSTDGSAGTFTTLTGPLVLQTSGNNNRLLITQDGNVGIGTNNPTQTLHVVGNSYINGTISGNNAAISGNIYSNNLLLQGDNTDGYVRSINASSKLYLGANNANYLTITPSGQIAFNYLNQAITANLNVELNKYPVRKATCSATTHTITTTVPIAGTRATLILVGYGTTSVVTFSTGFKTNTTLSVTNLKTFIMEFVSDGTNMLEVSRSLGFTS